LRNGALEIYHQELVKMTHCRGNGQDMRCDDVKHFCGIFSSAHRHYRKYVKIFITYAIL
jgi:hypothetical protein